MSRPKLPESALRVRLDLTVPRATVAEARGLADASGVSVSALVEALVRAEAERERRRAARI